MATDAEIARFAKFANSVQRRKTDPDHKAKFLYGVTANCSCGWIGATCFGKGSKSSAAGEWHSHLEKCNKVGKVI